MALDMKALRQQFAKKENNGGEGGNNNYYPFWQMDTGKNATVRFIPDLNQDNPFSFLVKKMHHELKIGDEVKKIPCLKQYDAQADCPICKASAAAYKSEGKDTVTGKALYRKLQYVGQVLVIADPLPTEAGVPSPHQGTVKIVSMGPKIYDSIKDSFESGELEVDPSDYHEGTNFQIKKTQSGEYADYSRSKFTSRPSALTDAEIEIATAAQVDLSTLLPAKPEYAKVEELLQDYFRGSLSSPSTPAAPRATASEATAAALLAPRTTTPVQAAAPAAVTQPEAISTDSVESEAEKILASFRARKKAAEA